MTTGSKENKEEEREGGRGGEGWWYSERHYIY